MNYKAYNPKQILILPASLKDWLPEGNLCYFISDIVEELDILDIEEQINFTEPKSKIMKDPRSKGFIHGYKAEVVEDASSQGINAASVPRSWRICSKDSPILWSRRVLKR